MAEHDPTAAEVAAAIATLQAFEHARETAIAESTQPQVESPTTSSAPSEPAPAAKPVPSLVEAVDPYLARSVKSSPNGF